MYELHVQCVRYVQYEQLVQCVWCTRDVGHAKYYPYEQQQ